MLWNDDAWFLKVHKDAKAAENAGDTHDAERFYRSLYEKAMEEGERETIHAARLAWIHFLIFACRYDEARLETERFLPELPEGEQSMCQLRMYSASIAYYKNSYEEVVNITQRLLSAPECSIKIKVEAFNTLALAKRHMGMLEQALEHFHEALLMVRRHKLLDDGHYDGNIALVYEDQHRYSEALAAYQVALEKAKKAGDEEMVVFALTGVGEIKRQFGLFTEAKEVFDQAVAKAESMDNKLMAQNLHVLMADLEREQGNLVAAFDHATASIILLQEEDIPESEAEARLISGWILLDRARTNDAASALNHSRRIAEIYTELGLDFGLAAALTLQAAALLALGEADKASKAALQAIKLAEGEGGEGGDEDELTYYTAFRALTAQDKPDEAADMLRRAAQMVQNKAANVPFEARKDFMARPRNKEILAALAKFS